MKCGTRKGSQTGWRRHDAAGETPCDPCKSAHQRYEQKLAGGANSGERGVEDILRRRTDAAAEIRQILRRGRGEVA